MPYVLNDYCSVDISKYIFVCRCTVHGRHHRETRYIYNKCQLIHQYQRFPDSLFSRLAGAIIQTLQLGAVKCNIAVV